LIENRSKKTKSLPFLLQTVAISKVAVFGFFGKSRLFDVFYEKNWLFFCAELSTFRKKEQK